MACTVLPKSHRFLVWRTPEEVYELMFGTAASSPKEVVVFVLIPADSLRIHRVPQVPPIRQVGSGQTSVTVPPGFCVGSWHNSHSTDPQSLCWTSCCSDTADANRNNTRWLLLGITHLFALIRHYDVYLRVLRLIKSYPDETTRLASSVIQSIRLLVPFGSLWPHRTVNKCSSGVTLCTREHEWESNCRP